MTRPLLAGDSSIGPLMVFLDGGSVRHLLRVSTGRQVVPTKRQPQTPAPTADRQNVILYVPLDPPLLRSDRTFKRAAGPTKIKQNGLSCHCLLTKGCAIICLKNGFCPLIFILLPQRKTLDKIVCIFWSKKTILPSKLHSFAPTKDPP